MLKSLKYLNKAISRSPMNFTLLNSKANIFNELKMYELALDYYEQVIKLNPMYAPAFNNIAVIF